MAASGAQSGPPSGWLQTFLASASRVKVYPASDSRELSSTDESLPVLARGSSSLSSRSSVGEEQVRYFESVGVAMAPGLRDWQALLVGKSGD